MLGGYVIKVQWICLGVCLNHAFCSRTSPANRRFFPLLKEPIID
uniref:Uncharacterized protein n=1 Tax=Arundo donax TaxID=35708 RepID=A0A0A9H4F9_ARUDO